MEGARLSDPRQGGGTVVARATTARRDLLAAFNSPLRDRQRLVCGVGTQPATGTPWCAAGRPAQPVPLAVPDPLPPDWGLTCSGQLIDVPPGRYDWIYLLIEAAQNGARDGAESRGPADRDGDGTVRAEEAWLHYEQAVDPEWLYLAEPGAATRLPVTRQAVLTGLRLPSRPTLRVVAATLVGPLNC